MNLGKEKQKVTSAPFFKKKNVTFPQPGYPSYRIPRPSTLSNSMSLIVEYQHWVYQNYDGFYLTMKDIKGFFIFLKCRYAKGQRWLY